MEIRDPLHGSISIQKHEIPIIQSAFFQRLRNIKQLGLAEYIFPGATHTRFLHSIGTMNVGVQSFNSLFGKQLTGSLQKEFCRLRETFKLACLLHDIGHAPLSHATETAMPKLSSLNIPREFLNEQDGGPDRKASHEDYTVKAIADGTLSESFGEVEKVYGVTRRHVADLIRGTSHDSAYFTLKEIDYFPILHQLVSSELDCDRMDYLLRDSYFCGVSYGAFDLDWLIDNLEICVEGQKAFLGLNERAIITFDDFLLGRYHMFVNVYFHYRSVCLEQLLYRYFESSPKEYQIPSDLEQYIEHDDHYLMNVLRDSSNPHAQAIIKNKIPTKIYESFSDKQHEQLENICQYLKKQNIDYIKSSAQGRLSKYSEKENGPQYNYPIKVARKLYQNTSQQFSDIDQVTELFQKFSKAREIRRLHCNMEALPEKQRKELEKLLQT